jgi:RHS repeat-associated protein
VTFDYTFAYNLDGTQQSLGIPAAGNLPAESVVTRYDDWMRPTELTGTSSYVTGTSYDPRGQLLQATLHTGSGSTANLVWGYDRGNGRVTRAGLYREGSATWDKDATYAYDPVGNVTSISDAPTGGSRDVQCFRYDGLRRMTEAWATAGSCDQGPDAVGGPAPYHQSWTLDKAGNRRTETIHGATDVVHTYTYSPTQPHTVTGVSKDGAAPAAYRYDAAGNTVTRPGETLTWDAEGHVATSKPDGGQETSFVYDAGGERLVRKDPGGTTFHLPAMDLRFANGTLTTTRYYAFSGVTVAVRTGAGVFFQATDHNGTSTHSINAATGALQTRWRAPFGGGRGPEPTSWPDQRGFLGGTQDNNGLTNIGVRDYDRALGRFISDDPVTVLTEPQQLQGYSYSNANPVTMSDPSGACLPEICGNADELVSAEERNAANCVVTNRACGPYNPNRIITVTIYPRGTVMVALANGKVIINGYVIPSGIEDPAEVARRVDANISADDYDTAYDFMKATIASIGEGGACFEICTLEQHDQANLDYRRMNARPTPVASGLCIGGSGSVTGGLGGGSICLVKDQKNGWSLTFTGNVAGGVFFPGGFGGIGVVRSDAPVDDWTGQFWTGDFNAAYGLGADYNHAWDTSNTIHVDQALVGLGTPGAGAGFGPSWTCALFLSKPEFTCLPKL